MSRRKQTKPFKVEDKLDLRRDKKRSLRKVLSKTILSVQRSSPQNDTNSENLTDGYATADSDSGKRSKRGNKCNECGKILASSLSLVRHKLTHSANKPFECPKCGAGFKTSSNMHRHLRIHFREKEQEEKQEFTKESLVGPSQRTSRQNIRTPNKFKEFDVDLVGVTPRINNDGYVTNARSYSKPKETMMTRKQVASSNPKKQGNGKSIQDEVSNDEKEFYEDDLPNLNPPKQRRTSESSKASTTKPEDLICHICNKSFISKFGLMTHAITHPEPHDPNKCNLCDQSFSTPKGLSVHNVIVHKIAEYKEEASVKEGHEEEGFNDIALIDFSADKFPVVAESACTEIKRSQSERDTQHIFVCKKCDKAFPCLEALKLHVENNHLKQPVKVEAKSEIENFLTIFGLGKLDKEKTRDETPVKIYDGVDDDYIYTSKSAAIRDIPPWMQESPDLMNENYLKEDQVQFPKPKLRLIPRRCLTYVKDGDVVSFNHINDSDNSAKTREIAKRRSRNYVGEETISKTIDISKMSGDGMNMEKNGERNVFWCRICNYSSHEKSALVRHLLTHSGIRPYFCKICDYAFTTKANCERHVRKRHNRLERKELNEAVRCDWEMLKKAPRDDIYMISGSNSSCPVCNQSFSCNNELKQHLKQHEERQFVCQLCNVRCTTRNNCVRHILHKHPGIPHQEANTIITFTGTGRNMDILQKPEDVIKEKDDVDISRGCLGVKKTNKRLPPPLIKARSKHRSAHPESPSLKKRRLSPQDDIERSFHQTITPDDQDSNIPISLPESEVLKDYSDSAQIQKTIKCLPLIPLLKIKAYNEAAARCYSDMVTLYQNLNFFNSNALDDTVMPMSESPRQESEDLVTGQETAFICRSCSNTFLTEDELNQHILSCNENEADMDNTMPDEFEQIFNHDQHYETSNWRNDDLFVNTDVPDTNNDWIPSNNNNEETALTPDWANTNSFTESPMKQIDSSSGVEEIGEIQMQDGDASVHNKSYENNQSVERWMNNTNVAVDSPYSIKSNEAVTNMQDYENEFGVEGQQVFANHGKESSYIEDSLLLSMYRDGDKEYENDNLNIASSRFSSSFPTMVNMESPTMTRIKYQNRGPYNSSPEIEGDKVQVPKGRYSVRKCPQCDKTFPWASSLRRHIMTHTGLKLYMCRVCKMRFTTRSNLIRHVYRRHGMAKQHPDFASCLAKLHPSDTLLKEVEADVRRRVDGTKKIIPQAVEIAPVSSDQNDVASNQDEDELQGELKVVRRKKTITSDFQSMLEEDPETMLVDLDYSPRDELLQRMENNKGMKSLAKTTLKKTSDSPAHTSNQPENVDDNIANDDVKQEEDNDVPVDMTTHISTGDQSYAEELQKVENDHQSEPHYHRGKNLRRTSENKSSPSPKKSPAKVKSKGSTPNKGRNKQSTQFVCGLCKKIFKTVPDLISHLDTHNVPHSWHCPVCGVPFTNKYNCQRHLTRRHGRADRPLYVEDSRHGPRTARGQPRKVEG